MGRQFQYTSLDRVLAKVYRDVGLEEVSTTDVVEWAGEALELMEIIAVYEEAVAFMEVKNHQADLPNGLHSIVQLARNNRWVKSEQKICPAEVVLDCDCDKPAPVPKPTPCNLPVVLDCHGTPISDHNLAYYRPYFDLQYEYYGWSNSNNYRENYTPIRLANHSFFNTIVCEEDNRIYDPCCEDEYTIVGDKLKFSFKEGFVALAYHRQKIDPETGYPMIPDEISIITAVTMYITMKYMSRLWYMGREGYADKMQKAEQDWQWYCKQAGTKQMMLHGIDQHQNFTEERFTLIPRRDKYYNFFGKLGRAEYTGFKDSKKINLRGT